ncbi:hypothetical protein [Histophilus somni]|nr:hypothetical protein [Histophilus somni]QQF66401.1 hypothetical protein JFL60_03880 [Histophilus somni]QQF71143.1 hypothetical protein JFL59_03895 [Histophilus somni]QQF73060.1 hypothetical protein JFL50_04305 [Histophilus somni]QQF79462.1 hypothetical protein JFL53_03945 [Histophilus somni]QQF81209.1 hypothetical protein JFL51_03735 [Histophilus somni]
MTYFIDFSIMKKSEKKRPHLDRVKQEKKSGLSIFLLIYYPFVSALE